MGLQTATGADAHHLKLTKRRVLGASGEINIGQGIQLVDYNIYVVAPDTRREHRDALALIGACHRVKLATGHIAFHGIEMGCHHSHTSRVAHKNDFTCQLLGAKVEMKYGTIIVDDELGGGIIGRHGIWGKDYGYRNENSFSNKLDYLFPA